MTYKRFLSLVVLMLLVTSANSQNFFTDESIIYYSDIVVPASVFVCDLDADGDEDVVAAFYHEVFLYENLDGKGNYSEGQLILTLNGEATFIHAADIDGDGHPDILAAVVNDDKIVWYKNIDGTANFGPQQIISAEVDRPWSVFASDIDGDGDLDVLSTSIFDEKIAWYENLDGTGNFGPQQIVLSSVPWPNAGSTADMNNNGYQDVLFVSGSYTDSKINWIENTDGQGTFDSLRVISTAVKGATFIYPADLDGDGDLDILSASVFDDKIAWYENIDGLGTFGPQRVISTMADGAVYVHAADLDGDGDLDVLSASNIDDKIAWYENINGEGLFGKEQIIATNAWEAGFVHVTDVDGDGLPDVLSASVDFKIAWYKNTLPLIILEDPADTTILPNSDASMTIGADFVQNYQWQVNAGEGFEDISDNALYGGTNTATLIIINAPLEMSGYLYRCLVSDENATLHSGEAKLTVKDTIKPTLTLLPEDQVVDADTNCMAILPDYTSIIEATDNSPGDLYITQSPLPLVNTVSGLTNTIILTVTDETGNSSSATFNVAVIDRIPPVISSLHNDQTLELNAFGDVYLPDYTSFVQATDNCTKQSSLVISQDPEPYTNIGDTFGETRVTLSVSDVAGNTTNVAFSVYVLDDINPTVICVEDQERMLAAGETVYTTSGSEFDPVSVSDNDAVVKLVNNFFNSSTLDGYLFQAGTTTVVWTATDPTGNEGQCTFDVTVVPYYVNNTIYTSDHNGIAVYPNPTSGNIYFETSGLPVKRLKIMDVRGVTLIDRNDINQDGEVNLEYLTAGIYLCNITTREGVVVIKIIKE